MVLKRSIFPLCNITVVINGEKVKLTNEIEREKKNETQKDEYVYFITMTDIKNIFDNTEVRATVGIHLEKEKENGWEV